MKGFATILAVALACFAASLWIFYSASAQSLPKLTVGPVSNRLFNLNWPCTNAGFALQESGGLTNWQTGALMPDFNSNNTTFSVAASATNATHFFRLARPADLRGIYVYVGLETATNSSDAVPLMTALNLPGVDGMLLVGLACSSVRV